MKSLSPQELALRNGLMDYMSKNGMDFITDNDGAQRVLDEANGKVRAQLGDARDTFAERQKQAVEGRGVVMSGLNEAEVNVVNDIPRHPYTGNIAQATEQAIRNAKAKYNPNGEAKVLHYDNYGKEFDYTISGNAIEICLSPKHQAKSENKGIHLSLAEHLDEIINNSIEVEEHPDYIKDKDGKRGENVNPNSIMHRFYGVAVIDGKPCRVMTLMREDGGGKESNGVHSYEVQKIEVLDKELPSTTNGVGRQTNLSSGYPLAKLLKGIEKSYDKGKYLLEESEKSSSSEETPRFFRTPDGEAYGFTVDGKIYIDTRIADSETPIHEYGHLWTTAVKASDPEKWSNIVDVMKASTAWDEAKKLYPELKSDDDIADEAVNMYSGKRGAERLRRMQEEIAKGDGSATEKAKAIGAINKLRQVLSDFWKSIAKTFGFSKEYRNADEIADAIMSDLLEGVDPRKVATDDRLREQFVGDMGAKNLDRADFRNTGSLGERGRNLDTAKVMERDGKDAKAIKMATGWERGADGQWRYEIDNATFGDLADKVEKKIKEATENGESLASVKIAPTTLSKLIGKDHPIIKAYPQLENTKIAFKDLRNDNRYAQYEWSHNTITINSEYAKSLGLKSVLKTSLAHEVQHAIQKIEAFERGGSADELGYDKYHRLAGEVEARNVEKRFGMSAEERRSSLASETEDVPREDQIFLDHDVDFSKNSVGETAWKAGPISSRLPEGHERKVILSRYDKPVDIVGIKEWGDSVQKQLDDAGINDVPWNVFTPEQRDEMVNRGFEITAPNEKVVGADGMAVYEHWNRAYEEWRNGGGSKPFVSPKYDYRELPTVKGGKRSNLPEELFSHYGERAVEDGEVDFSKKVFGGNSGYVGYSISKRGARAKEEGRFPKGEFKKEYGVTPKAFDALVDLGVIDDSEWHHTSMYGNKTTFYGWDDGALDIYQANKKEIDSLAREVAKVRGFWKEHQYCSIFNHDMRFGDINDFIERDYKIKAIDDGTYEELRNVENIRETEGYKKFYEEEMALRAEMDELKKNAAEAKKRIEEIFEGDEEEPQFSKKTGVEAEEELKSIFAKPVTEELPKELSSYEEARKVYKDPITTFLGEKVAVKDGTINKMMNMGRMNLSGAIRPTLEQSDFAIKDIDESTIYVKRFKKPNGESVYNVAVVNKKGELEDYISSVHIKSDNNLLNKIKNGAELLRPNIVGSYEKQVSGNPTPSAKVENISETTKSGEVDFSVKSPGVERKYQNGVPLKLEGETIPDYVGVLSRSLSRNMGNDAAKETLAKELQTAADKYTTNALRSSELRRLAGDIRVAKKTNLPVLLLEVDQIVGGARVRQALGDLNKTLKTAMTKQNNQGMTVAKGVDEYTRIMFETVNKATDGLLKSGIEAEMGELKKNAAEAKKRIEEIFEGDEEEPQFSKKTGVEAEEELKSIFAKPVTEELPKEISSLEEFTKVFDKPVKSIIGEHVAVGEGVYNKILRNSRRMLTGAILPTLQQSDFVLKDNDSSNIYVKRFKKPDGESVYNVAIVNKKGELEDYVSSVHIKSDNNLLNKIKNGAELILPTERTTYGQSPTNSTPNAKVENISETAKSEEVDFSVKSSGVERKYQNGVPLKLEGETIPDYVGVLSRSLSRNMGNDAAKETLAKELQTAADKYTTNALRSSELRRLAGDILTTRNTHNRSNKNEHSNLVHRLALT